MQRTIVLLIFIFIVIFVTNSLFADPTPQDTTRAVAAQQITKVSDVRSFWAMAQLGGGIGYVIMGVLTIGLFLIFVKGIELLMDQRSSRPLRKASFPTMSLSELELAVKGEIAISPHQSSGYLHGKFIFKRNKLGGIQHKMNYSILREVVKRLLSFYRAVGNASNMQQELTTFIDQQNEKFEAFRNRLHFLSDSAGALGLLGTVWGVFLTFFGGSLDSEKILNGMGVALITTLLGLVVSLIINFFGTEIYSAFNRRLDIVTKKADELRLRLSHFDTSPSLSVVTAGGVISDKPQVDETTATPNLTLRLDNSFSSKLIAGELAAEAIRFQVTDHEEKPAPGRAIILEADGAVHFGDNKHKAAYTSDEQGEVAIDLYGSETIGVGEIRYWMEGEENQAESLSLNVIPDLPSKINIVSGNDQTGIVGSELSESLKINVLDRFDNPVPNAEVVFKLTMGKGKFKGGDHELVTHTDANGFAESKLKLGDKAGFHMVHALIKNSECEGAEFRILCKSLDE